MISFGSKQTAEHFEIGLLAPVFAVWTAVVLVVGCVGIIVVSTTALSAPRAEPNMRLEPLAEWIDQTGSASVIRGPIVRALGLPAEDLRVRERGFRTIGEQFTHVCSVSSEPALQNAIFFACVDEATGDAVVWMANRSGRLEKTASFNDGLAIRSSNRRLESAFLGEMTYFLLRLKDQLYRDRTAPTPGYDVATGILSYRRRTTTLSSETIVLFSNPWVLPAIGLVLATALHSRPKSR